LAHSALALAVVKGTPLFAAVTVGVVALALALVDE
jgi:hypothetical protein